MKYNERIKEVGLQKVLQEVFKLPEIDFKEIGPDLYVQYSSEEILEFLKNNIEHFDDVTIVNERYVPFIKIPFAAVAHLNNWDLDLVRNHLK